ncbi:lipocalin-like domain-containing protein [uncultured Caulobacter sp.]|uniref:lipocalin-like domain-containing protein n=1 Tax=uncultured Caulobacter sp. TaxID=158749 RepID=UPI002628A71B|nr:lipocalin-like domain-containing protein [uncultured Caulobacter sp.]
MRGMKAGLAFALALTMTQAMTGAARADDFPLAGTWTLTLADQITASGARAHDYGEAPKGRLMIDSQGRYSLQIYKSERTGFASGDKKRGTAEEYADAVLGSSTHYGTIVIDDVRHALLFKIAGASFKTWEGSTQARPYVLNGDVLSYRVPARPDGSTAISEWKRDR